MSLNRTAAAATLAVLTLTSGTALRAQHALGRSIDGRPDAVIDLRTTDGAKLAGAQWRYSDVSIVDARSNAPGPDLRPTGPLMNTYDYIPKANAANFDDSRWETIDPPALETRRGHGKLSFNWYRTAITVPARVGTLDTTGTTIVFEIVVDDYAEVSVDGQLPRVLGQTGGPLVKGFNAPNRVVLTRNAKPGQRIQLAIFGANGPLSDLPSNFIWVRSATLDFYRQAPAPAESFGRIVRRDAALDAIVPPGARIEKLAEGFQFTEGPVWVPDGYLLFSDPNNNTIYRWSEDDGVSVFRAKSGYAGVNIGEYRQPGSNGLAIDSDNRVTINQHGYRRVIRVERTGAVTVLADRYQGKRLNSPNDLVYQSDGSLYFTDPPFGLPKAFDDPAKELPFSGVFRWKDGAVQLLTTELSGPNGIAFSPDEKYLYVGNWDEKNKVVMRYEVAADGTLANGRVFADLTSQPGEDAIDGVKVDTRGNVYVSGPGGLWIYSPDGKALGLIEGAEHPHNFAWGDADGRALYLTSRTGVYRLRLSVAGSRPFQRPTN